MTKPGARRLFGRPESVSQLPQQRVVDPVTEERVALRRQVESNIAAGWPVVVQPIVDAFTADVVGYELLSRTPGGDPAAFFAQAAEFGLGVAAEAVVVRQVVDVLARLPEDVYLSVNVSPHMLLDARLGPALADADLRRVVLELTDEVRSDDYVVARSVLDDLRAEGLRLAVDDAGAGFASLRRIGRMTPDIIKLDIGMTRDAASDVIGRALVAAFTSFAKQTGADVVAEGVETVEQAELLREQGVGFLQGWLYGQPVPPMLVPTSDVSPFDAVL
jgi:EAL domain-containing protein (putative c-di-GMP-specific phosphodiesterase class I)